jgi:capsular polysaccharide export protein
MKSAKEIIFYYLHKQKSFFVKSFLFFREIILPAFNLVSQVVTFWKPTAWVFNVAKWKRPLIRKHLSKYNVRFLALRDDVYKKERRILWSYKSTFIVWGRTLTESLSKFSHEHGIPIHHIEDGFFRSIGLGGNHVLPYSLCYDRTGLYYDSSRPSDLEILLETYDFQSNKKLLENARCCIALIRELRLSKYNEVRTDFASFLYGPKVRTRILVIGQVEDDQSLLYGCERIMANAELIRLAADENPDAQIIYKPHPDVLAGLRKEIWDTIQLSHLAEILQVPLTLGDALHDVDRVYTLTSLAGFEALINGVPVTTVGAPFYSGWGLTDARQKTGRRTRNLTLEEVFAGAYLLYPKYIDPETSRESTLSEVIEIFQERLSEIEIVTPQMALLRLKPYNFSTLHSVDSRFLYNSTSTEIAIISDSAEALLVARGMAAQGKRVTFITTMDALANDESILLAPEECETIKVTSIHKRYGVPMSQVEASAVELTQTFSDSLRLAISEIAAQHLSPEMNKALCLGLEDYIYYEALRFYGIKACLEEFEKVILIFKDIQINFDIPKSFYFHGKAQNQLGKIYLSLIGQDAKEILRSITSPATLDFQEPQDLAKMRTEFSSFWWSLQDSTFNDYASQGRHIAICGNVSNENYAYSPASLKLVEAVENNSTLPILFFNSGLLPATGQDEIKSITLSGGLSERCKVYNGHLARFRKKYPQSILERAALFDGPLYERVVILARQRLPEEFVDIFKPRLQKYTTSLFAQVIFVAEASQIMDHTVLLATAMDRSHISRMLAAIARARNVRSIGIQPQIISASTRYRPPAVDAMGVIDTSQTEIYYRLGATEDSLHLVGSVNIISRLVSMDEAARAYGKPPAPKTLFFAMQHSTAYDMIKTSLALRDICMRHGYKLVVKPHPHQELPILNEVRSIFGDSPNTRVLSRGSDTYEAVARCSIVVGLFSSVLLESALYGKDVVIAAFRDLDESIDFSLQGLAVKVITPEELERQLVDLVDKGPASVALRETRDRFLQLNPQFLPPYNTARLEQFIAAHIPLQSTDTLRN